MLIIPEGGDGRITGTWWQSFQVNRWGPGSVRDSGSKRWRAIEKDLRPSHTCTPPHTLCVPSTYVLAFSTAALGINPSTCKTFCFVVVVWDRVSLYSPDCLGTCLVDQPSTHRDSSVLTSPISGVEVVCHCASCCVNLLRGQFTLKPGQLKWGVPSSW